MNYLIWQMLSFLLAAALFGLFFGWLIWGSLVRRLRQDLAGNDVKRTPAATNNELEQFPISTFESPALQRIEPEPVKPRQDEVSELYDQIRVLSKELQQAQEGHAVVLAELAASEPPKAMTATAGAYSSVGQSASVYRGSEPGAAKIQNSAELKRLSAVIRSLFEPLDAAEIGQRAFRFGEQRGFQNGTEQEDWLKAERQLHGERLQLVRDSLKAQGLFE